ncbi:MAG: phage portal protein, partial [Hungatella sp.]
MQKLKDDKLLELPKDAKAEYITRTFDESGVEILKKAIEQDIHKFSHIPCMTDEAFGGNVSGVAMEFKLLGMEN